MWDATVYGLALLAAGCRRRPSIRRGRTNAQWVSLHCRLDVLGSLGTITPV